MTPLTPHPITEVLSSAITPVTLITGVAFLTSIMTPRFGRCIDRIRALLSEIRKYPRGSVEYENSLKQLQILYSRTRILRNTLTMAGLCIFFVVLTIWATLSNLLFNFPGPGTTLGFFSIALIWLVLLTIGFTYDFLQSLNAVRLELDQGIGAPAAAEAQYEVDLVLSKA